MFPVLVELGPFKVHAYGLMIALGFLLSMHLVKRDAARSGMNPHAIGDMVFWSFLIGLAGTRALHILMYSRDYSWRDPLGWIAIWKGGLVFQGAVPPVAIFCWYYLRKKRMSFRKTADLVFPYVALGHAFGRLGCFLNGCCYGIRTTLPWGIPFRRVPWNTSLPPTGSPAYLDHCRTYSDLSYQDHWSYPVHPTQLYEMIFLLSLFALLLHLRKKQHLFDGFSMPVYFVFYGVYRFFAELLRGDHNPTHLAGALSDQQIICILFVLFGSASFFWFRTRPAR